MSSSAIASRFSTCLLLCRIDSTSLRGDAFTESSKKFLCDADAMDMFCHTKKLEDVTVPGDFDCLYIPGGHGCCTDGINNPVLKKAIEATYNAGKLVATVCHGPIALAECTKVDGSTPLVQGLTVTGFSDAEEAAVGHTETVPYLIESRFVEQGAKYEKAANDWAPKVCVDGNLITGQNPASSEPAAKKVVEMLSA